ncbi:MAG: hypothetical protein ACE5F6_00440 [Anaerolineae bacterium]
MDRCKTCFWCQEISDEELRKFVGKPAYCRVFPANPNPPPVGWYDYCGLHRPKKVGFELRIGGWVFRVEHGRMG